MPNTLDTEITQLKELNLRQLRRLWDSRLNENPPLCRSVDILRRILACKLQEKAQGGLTPATQKKLRKIAGSASLNPVPKLPLRARLKPGTVLTREWEGTLHQVQVLEDGFEYEGKRLTSLSEAARMITGTRWSGPLFFGLKR